MLCLRVKRKSLDSSLDGMPEAAAATAMLCRLIILPITPPLELEAAINVGFRSRSSSGDHLQVAEKRVCRRIAAGQEDTQPSEQRTEEREERSGRSECQAECRGRAAVIQEKCQAPVPTRQ